MPDGDARPPVRLATACLRLPGAAPLRLLASTPGPRGFWAKGERWVAHAGLIAAIGADPGPERFRQVRERAAHVTSAGGPTWPSDADPSLAGRLRFYGGFSFQNEPGASRLWAGFPCALFHLPAVELEGDAEGARLRVREALGPGDEPGVVRERLERRARELADLVGRAANESAEESLEPGGRFGDLPAVPSDRGAWDASVERLIEEIAAGRVRKVVLARTLDVQPSQELDPLAVLGHLWRANRGTHVFYFEPVPGRVVLGAAPETIATLRRGVFHATAVAGSTRPGVNTEERAGLAEGLLTSGKDRAEHRIALDDMVERLAEFAESVHAEAEPHVLALPRIQHLESEIRARMRDGRTVLEVLAALHPTPAVCGYPREQAHALLAREEGFERGWYAGPVGWFDAEGNGMFAPALRSAVLAEDRWRLFAGAGIVAGSSAEAEWTETGIKLESMLRALGAAAGR